MNRIQHITVAAAIVAVLATLVPAAAATHRYSLELYDRQRVAFQLEIPVAHPGTLAIVAEWQPNRQLTFRIEGPGDPSQKIRRTGTSPQRIEIEVDPESPHLAEVWKLEIFGLPARGAGKGNLSIEVPEPPTPEEIQEELERLNPPEPEPEPWMVEREAPDHLGPDRVLLYETVEGLRGIVVLPGWTTGIDSCGWQTDFLQYAVDWRDRTTGGTELPETSTARFLLKLSAMVERVDELRTSDDPVLTGPMPESPSRRRHWLSLRRGRILPLEREIDLLLDHLRNGHAPRLENERWPQRFISCLMACERFFEERARVGEEQASNREIVETQWEAALKAADAMEALASLTAVLPEQTE